MQYNRSLDYLALAMSELRKGKPVLAARLLAKAAGESDAQRALAIIEASNGAAFKPIQAKLEAAAKAKVEASKAAKVQAKQRLTAEADEVEEEVEGDGDEEMDLDQDPLDEVEDAEDEGDEVDDEVEASTVMANTLKRMIRKG